jgi:hypothetical protein
VAVSPFYATPPEKVTPNTRAERALDLYRERGQDIHKFGTGLYRVPSCTDSGFYTVDYLAETCTCKDFEFGRGRVCKHILAVGISVAKRRGATLRSLAALEGQLAHEIMDHDERQELRDRVLALRRRVVG